MNGREKEGVYGEDNSRHRRDGVRYVRGAFRRAVRNAFQVKKVTSSHTKKQTVMSMW